MDYINVGKFVATHGLKGEIKIISNLNNTSEIFKIDRTIYIGDKKEPFVIKSYRKHQKYDMVTLKEIDSIDSVIPYKNMIIYINKDELDSNIFKTIIGYDVYNNDVLIGKVIEILKGVKYEMIVVGNERIIIPYIDTFVTTIDHDNKIIKTNYML